MREGSGFTNYPGQIMKWPIHNDGLLVKDPLLKKQDTATVKGRSNLLTAGKDFREKC